MNGWEAFVVVMPAPISHQVDDAVTVGATRWVIRSIVGEKVTLEATNVSPGITWTTTLSNLPDHVKEQTR